MRVLVACEYSGKVRDAFTAKGHDAMSADLLPTETEGKHYQGDVRDILDDGFDLLVAHPPCTTLCNSGVKHLHTDPARWFALFDAADFFIDLLTAPIEKVCVENPIPHRYANRLIGIPYTQLVHPFNFGHTERKATCLWLKGLPPLMDTCDARLAMVDLPKNETDRIHYMSPGAERSKARSETYTGIAEAMAHQW